MPISLDTGTSLVLQRRNQIQLRKKKNPLLQQDLHQIYHLPGCLFLWALPLPFLPSQLETCLYFWQPYCHQLHAVPGSERCRELRVLLAGRSTNLPKGCVFQQHRAHHISESQLCGCESPSQHLSCIQPALPTSLFKAREFHALL